MNIWKQEFMNMAERFYRKARDKLLGADAIIQGTHFIPETENMKNLKKECNDICTNILFTLNYLYPESQKLEVKQDDVSETPQCPKCGWNINRIEQARRNIYTNTIVCKVCGHKWDV